MVTFLKIFRLTLHMWEVQDSCNPRHNIIYTIVSVDLPDYLTQNCNWPTFKTLLFTEHRCYVLQPQYILPVCVGGLHCIGHLKFYTSAL